MKFKKLIFSIAIATVCSPEIVLSQVMIEAGDVTIVKEENGSIEVETGNTQLRVPQQSIEHEIEDDYSIYNGVINSSNSRQTIRNSSCRTRNIQSTYQSNNSGSNQTVTQTNTSTNICQ